MVRKLLGTALAFLLLNGTLWAQAYPTRPITLVVTFPAGKCA